MKCNRAASSGKYLEGSVEPSAAILGCTSRGFPEIVLRPFGTTTRKLGFLGSLEPDKTHPINCALGQISAEGRKRTFPMWTRSLTTHFAGFVVLASLSFVPVNLWGFRSLKSIPTLEGTRPSWAGQQLGRTARETNAPTTKRVDDDYTIGPSDVLAISVWKDTELTRTVPVRPDGKISLPLIGELEVSGLTALKVQHLISQKLNDYISNPQVTVIVQEVRSRTYTIVGKVGKPGSYDLGKPTTVLEAIAIAGGLLDFAKGNKIYIMRRWADGSTIKIPFNYKKVIKGEGPDSNVDLRNGDTIVVP